MEYKKYPWAPHQDPSSPEYISSELDSYHDRAEVEAYNTVIDNFKNDLQVQRKVWEAISNLDRPYKRGIPGIDTNLYETGPLEPELQHLGFPRRNTIMGPGLDIPDVIWSNTDRFIAQTPFHQKDNFTHYMEWEKERANR